MIIDDSENHKNHWWSSMSHRLMDHRWFLMIIDDHWQLKNFKWTLIYRLSSMMTDDQWPSMIKILGSSIIHRWSSLLIFDHRWSSMKCEIFYVQLPIHYSKVLINSFLVHPFEPTYLIFSNKNCYFMVRIPSKWMHDACFNVI